MSEEIKVFSKIEGMDSAVQNMRNVRKFLDNDPSDVQMKRLIDEFNLVLETSINEVLDFAKQKGVCVHEYPHTSASTIFQRMFGFWIADAHRTTSEGYSRGSFRIKIISKMYNHIRPFKKTSKPTKSGIVKCDSEIYANLVKNYHIIERYKNGDFKVKADEELLGLLAEIEEFYTYLENWENKSE